MKAPGAGSAAGSFIAGLAAVATLPLAVYATRFSETYELLHAGWAIPIVVVLAILALALARRSRVQSSVSLSSPRGPGVASVGRFLGILGLCMAASALVALGVYGLLEYVGSRE